MVQQVILVQPALKVYKVYKGYKGFRESWVLMVQQY
jgi:hypothetical protein